MDIISFHVHMDAPDTHTFTVHMHLPALGGDTLEVQLPAWTPGSYLIREYARHINTLQARNEQHVLPVEKTHKNSWKIQTAGTACVITYSVYAFEESVRTCWLDDTRASIIPAAMFLHIPEVALPVHLHIHPHTGFSEIATALPEYQGDKWQRYAENADTLYDSPIEIGNHKTYHFDAAGIPHTFVIAGEGNYQPAKMIEDFKRIIDTEVRIFQHHPCPAYLTILQTSNTMRGGLEHMDSTSLIFKRLQFEPRESYLEFISLFAHEYFHLWNVKRLRPKALGPFAYGEENYTTSLWIAEGFTSYYDDLIVYRAGLYSEQEYLHVVEKNINQSENAPGKHVQSVAEASFDAWIKYYRQNENSDNNQVSYYVRGGVIANLLDLLIIHHSGATYCLDDVMREAYHQFYINRNTGYTEDEFREILTSFAGIDLLDFYADHIFGTKPLPLQTVFGYAGLELHNTLEQTIETDHGIVMNDRFIITSIRKNSAGEKGGLYVFDEVLAINGYRMHAGLQATLMQQMAAGETLQFTVSRAGFIQTRTITVQATDKVQYILKPAAQLTAAQQRTYAKWMYRVSEND